MARRQERPVARGKSVSTAARRVSRAARASRRNRVLDRHAARWVRAFRALGDPTRARVLLALTEGEIRVGDLAERLVTSSSVISHQMRVLRDLGLVRCRRDGRSAFYALRAGALRQLFEDSLARVRGGGPVSRGRRGGGR